jgi:hypothetical protein
MENETRFWIYVMIHIFIIMIVVGLSFKIYIDSLEYNCEDCIVQFSYHKPVYGDVQFKRTLNASGLNLYEKFKQGECLVFWDRADGYKDIGGVYYE